MFRRVLLASSSALKTPVAGFHSTGRVSSAVASSLPAKAQDVAGLTETGWDYNVENAQKPSHLPSSWPSKPCEWQDSTVVEEGQKPRGPQAAYPDIKYHLPYDMSKYRLFGIPEAFFNFMHERTGVLGPYFLLYGGMITAFSKEYMIINEESAAFLVYLIAPIYIASRVGPAIDKGVREQYDGQLRTLEMMKKCKSSQFTNEADAIEQDVVRSEAGKELFQAYTINVENMIEAEFRQRQEQVYEAFKRRMDYQVALQSLEESIVQKQLVAWVKDEVNKAIKSRGEKENIRQCIADLKNISAVSA
jgi:hypothetical protein